MLKVLGAFIFTFRKPQDAAGLEAMKRALKALQRVVKGCGYAWDGVCLAVAMPQSLQPRLELGVEQWEDLCREFQFEYVDFEFKGRNEYGGLLPPVFLLFNSPPQPDSIDIPNEEREGGD